MTGADADAAALGGAERTDGGADDGNRAADDGVADGLGVAVAEEAGTDEDARGLATDGPPHAATTAATASTVRRFILRGSMKRPAGSGLDGKAARCDARQRRAYLARLAV